MSQDIIDTEQPEDTAPTSEAVAFSSALFTWKESPLSPFAIDREAAWHLHRHLVGAPPVQDVIEPVGAFAPDAIRILWFCAHDPQEWIAAPSGERIGSQPITQQWRRFTSEERAQRLEARISEWARGHITGDEIASAVGLAYEILSSAHKTRAIVPSVASAKKKSSPSRRSPPNTSASSPARVRGSSRRNSSAGTSRRKGDGATSTPGSLNKATKLNGRTSATRRSSGGGKSRRH